MYYSYKGVDFFSSHHKIACYIKKIKDNSLVLDVGCNAGFIGRTLRELRWHGNIDGIDKEKNYKSKAMQFGYNSFYNIDIETALENFKKKYDVIVFADVLEHLIRPEKVLLEIRKNLKNNGTIIISLPNIANAYIRLKLLLGNFDYSNRGILDRDHKFFYTKKTAINLIKKSKLKIINYDFTPIPLSVVNKKFSYGKSFFPLYYLLNIISSVRSEFFAYQLIFSCQ